MKKLVYIISILPVLALGQSLDQNYVKTTTYKTPTTTSMSSPSATEAVVQIGYFDGLGRPIQQVAHQQSNTGKDIVTHIEYDQFGRQTKEYLPYVNSTASLNYTEATSVLSELNGFYQNYNGGTLYPFSEKELEASPLNRVFKQAAPGDDWALGNGKEIKFDYQTNQANQVKLFRARALWNSSTQVFEPSFQDLGYYAANQLYVTVTKDENWVSGSNLHTTEEFKNKEGQVVLKKTYNTDGEYLTYYVYDQFGNLTYVIPPLAEGSSSNLDGLCYQYKYDYRNRLVEKKLPGKQWEFIVYDKLDRPVATGPAYDPYGSQSQGWLITEYDVFGRVVKTGWKQMTSNASARNSHQNAINGGGNPFSLTALDVLTENYYDDYSFSGAPSLPSDVEGQTLASNVKGLPTGSWVKILDAQNPNAAELSYTLYDDRYRPVRTYSSNYLGGYTQVDSKLDWSGKVEYTLTKHKYDTNTAEIVVKDMFEYSAQDRLTLHKQQINSLPEQLIASNTYDELGQLISKNVGGTDNTGAIGLQKVDYNYNIRGWLKAINDVNDITSENDLFAFAIKYNDPQTGTALYNGNISETYWRTGSDDTQRKYSYSYDALNRLLIADYSKPNNASTGNNYLEQLSYDKNGNILTLIRNGDLDSDGMIPSVQIDNLVYTYDNTQSPNRLMKVMDFSASPQGFKDDGDGVTDPNGDDYDYDLNGNMTVDQNKGVTAISYNHLNLPVSISFGTNGTITYLYDASGRKVKKDVQDNTTSLNTVVDYLSGGFQYENAQLQFFPHAEGYVNATKTRGGYLYNYVFNYTDHLGNIRLSYTYDEYIGQLKTLEENHYYPYGLKHTNYNSDYRRIVKTIDESGTRTKIPSGSFPTTEYTDYKYKYNGKEYQDELGLNMYDFHARNYMPDLGRTTTYDPLAEKFYDFSPQSFFNNNPVYFVDPTGMSTEQNEWKPKVNEDGSTSYIAEKGDTSATFAKQYNISESDAMSIVGNRTYEGMEVTGQQVFDVLGTESLKLDLNSGLDTPQRKIDHFIYAMHHSKSKGANYFRATDYFQNIQQGELQTPQNIRGNVILDNGKTATIQMTLPFYTSTGCFFCPEPTKYHFAFYSNKTITSPSQGNGTMFGGHQAINHYTIGYGFIFDGKYVLQGGSQHGIWMSILRKHDSSFERTILDRKVPEFRYHNFKPKTKM